MKPRTVCLFPFFIFQIGLSMAPCPSLAKPDMYNRYRITDRSIESKGTGGGFASDCAPHLRKGLGGVKGQPIFACHSNDDLAQEPNELCLCA